MEPASRDLVELGDIDALINYTDMLCTEGNWQELSELRIACVRAFERGKQLWPVSSHAEYRLALDGPPGMLAEILVPGAGQFALGPLSEVTAQNHTWDDCADFLDDTPTTNYFANERVIRGEDLRDAGLKPEVLEVPMWLQPWEPEYVVAEYKPFEMRAPSPPGPDVDKIDITRRTTYKHLKSAEIQNAFQDLVAPWTQESNGRCEVIGIEGTPVDALGALGMTSALIAPIPFDHALNVLAWSGASGGANGRRRGMATGRFAAWWVVTALADMISEWPVVPANLAREGERFNWWFWAPEENMPGWNLHLAVHDHDADTTWAVSAHDEAV